MPETTYTDGKFTHNFDYSTDQQATAAVESNTTKIFLIAIVYFAFYFVIIFAAGTATNTGVQSTLYFLRDLMSLSMILVTGAFFWFTGKSVMTMVKSATRKF